MAKRFIDTSFYKSPFVRGLKGSLKGLYCFIICDCDGAGIWSMDLEIAGVYVGFQFTKKEFEDAFVLSGKAIDLNNGKYFFPDFLEHQYPKGLSENNPAQNNVISDLKKYSLIDDSLKPLQRPLNGSKVMEKEMYKGKVMEKETVKQKKTDLIFPFDSEKFTTVWALLLTTKNWRKKEAPALQASLKKLSKFSEDEAIQMMENTIASDWKGLFELKPHEKPKSSSIDKILSINEQQEQELKLKYGR